MKGDEAFKKAFQNGLVITKAEMNMPGSLKDRLKLDNKFENDKCYKTLVKILFASAHCAKVEGTLTLAPVDLVEDTKKKLVGADAPAIGAGEHEELLMPDPSFSSLKWKPVGCIDSVLFWSREQAKILLSDIPKCIIRGGFGSGKTLLLLEKVKRLVQSPCDSKNQARKVIFISCLIPDYEESNEVVRSEVDSCKVNDIEYTVERDNYVLSIYDYLMKNKFSVMNEKVEFYSVYDICKVMHVKERLFYSKLAEFILKKNEEGHTVFVLDEFGDNMYWAGLSTEKKEEKIATFLNVTGEIAAQHTFPKIEQIIISLHPECEIDDTKFTEQGYRVMRLKNILRNTESIFGYNEAMAFDGQVRGESKATTVLGCPPLYIQGEVDDQDYYGRALASITTKKFVCIHSDESSIFNSNLFEAELRKRHIPSFRYQTKEDLMNLEEFLRAEEGCLRTDYEYARGTESPTLLLFTDYSDSSKLRGSTHLIYCHTGEYTPFTLQELGPKHFYLKGMANDPSLFRNIIDLARKHTYVFFVFRRQDSDTINNLMKKELEFRRLQCADYDEYPKTEEEIDSQLKSVQQGCIMYPEWTDEYQMQIRNIFLKLSQRRKIPLVVMHDHNIPDYRRSFDDILECDPDLLIQVEYCW